jgi:hypothetical protein
MLEITPVYSEKDKTFQYKMKSYWLLKQLGRIVIIGL